MASQLFPVKQKYVLVEKHPGRGDALANPAAKVTELELSDGLMPAAFCCDRFFLYITFATQSVIELFFFFK